MSFNRAFFLKDITNVFYVTSPASEIRREKLIFNSEESVLPSALSKLMKHIPEELLSPYNPESSEGIIYASWTDAGYFAPETLIQQGVCDENAPIFSMVLPPPNVTGILHAGHALTITIEDIMVRYKRMNGHRTLWIPGTDHAAIATQTKVEKQLDKEGVKKHDLGRDEFFKRVQEFALQSQSTIKGQIEKMGASVDWSREAFTLDEKRQKAVATAFKQMYDDGLIYRGYRIVNWDPKGRTTVSDEEVEHQPARAALYTFRYSADFPIPIATTRPETKVGDTAVAVHPDDARYQKYIGETYDLTFAGVPLSITIIGDESVDSEFGTGAVGVTPAHSMTDWEIALRHDLEVRPVIDERARMTVSAENLNEKKTGEAREIIVSWLRENELMESEKDIDQNISTAQRSGGIIEPLPKLQWFINVNKEFTIPRSTITGIEDGDTVTLKKLMKAAVESGDITFIPDRYIKNYTHWVDNLRDWCISRQIWYGHQIPVWYRSTKQRDSEHETRNPNQEMDEGQEIYVGTEPPEDGSWEQDPDTLDTWFSSGLWTFSTLGWPDQTEDLRVFHPTSMLETGHDILPFWVSRMILMSSYFLGEIPFEKVYLHGMVRDEKGRKMSKSLGNTINPVEVAEKYGTDALRMALIVGNTPGTDLSLSEDKIKAQKHFANKLWNASRFVLANTTVQSLKTKPDLTEKTKAWVDEFDQLTRDVTADLDNYHLHIAAEKLYHYFWHTFADVIIEESKGIITEGDEGQKSAVEWTLYYILTTCLTLLHPFMPFITEKIWSLLPTTDENELLMVRKWPTCS